MNLCRLKVKEGTSSAEQIRQKYLPGLGDSCFEKHNALGGKLARLVCAGELGLPCRKILLFLTDGSSLSLVEHSPNFRLYGQSSYSVPRPTVGRGRSRMQLAACPQRWQALVLNAYAPDTNI